jgi:hypothetical protein
MEIGRRLEEEKKREADVVNDSLGSRKVLSSVLAAFLTPRPHRIVVVFANELSCLRKRWCSAGN